MLFIITNSNSSTIRNRNIVYMENKLFIKRDFFKNHKDCFAIITYFCEFFAIKIIIIRIILSQTFWSQLFLKLIFIRRNKFCLDHLQTRLLFQLLNKLLFLTNFINNFIRFLYNFNSHLISLNLLFNNS